MSHTVWVITLQNQNRICDDNSIDKEENIFYLDYNEILYLLNFDHFYSGLNINHVTKKVKGQLVTETEGKSWKYDKKPEVNINRKWK